MFGNAGSTGARDRTRAINSIRCRVLSSRSVQAPFVASHKGNTRAFLCSVETPTEQRGIGCDRTQESYRAVTEGGTTLEIDGIGHGVCVNMYTGLIAYQWICCASNSSRVPQKGAM
ncbi:unnamed protein product [Ectocarpus sp. 12 AP-2014]